MKKLLITILGAAALAVAVINLKTTDPESVQPRQETTAAAHTGPPQEDVLPDPLTPLSSDPTPAELINHAITRGKQLEAHIDTLMDENVPAAYRASIHTNKENDKIEIIYSRHNVDVLKVLYLPRLRKKHPDMVSAQFYAGTNRLARMTVMNGRTVTQPESDTGEYSLVVSTATNGTVTIGAAKGTTYVDEVVVSNGVPSLISDLEYYRAIVAGGEVSELLGRAFTKMTGVELTNAVENTPPTP